MTAQTKKAFYDRLPNEVETENAELLMKIVASQMKEDGSTPLFVSTADGRKQNVILSPALTSSLLDVLSVVSSGRGFRMTPVGSELTTQQAADLLNVSRPFLVKLLDDGEIPYTKTSRHRRIRADELFAYKRKRDKIRSIVLSDLARMDFEEGLI